MGSVRLDPKVEEKVRQMAALKGLPLSEVHRLALAEYCEREMATEKRSRYDDIIGIGEGPRDLSTRASAIFGEIMDEKHCRCFDAKKEAVYDTDINTHDRSAAAGSGGTARAASRRNH